MQSIERANFTLNFPCPNWLPIFYSKIHFINFHLRNQFNQFSCRYLMITLLDSWSNIFVSGWLGIFPSPNISWRSAHLWGDPPGSAADIQWPLKWPLCGHHLWVSHPAPGQWVQWEWDRAVPGPCKQSQQSLDTEQRFPSAWWKNKQKILHIPQKITWDKQKP